MYILSISTHLPLEDNIHQDTKLKSNNLIIERKQRFWSDNIDPYLIHLQHSINAHLTHKDLVT